MYGFLVGMTGYGCFAPYLLGDPIPSGFGTRLHTFLLQNNPPDCFVLRKNPLRLQIPFILCTKNRTCLLQILFFVVGMTGFEPTASSSRTKRATKLRYIPLATIKLYHKRVILSTEITKNTPFRPHAEREIKLYFFYVTEYSVIAFKNYQSVSIFNTTNCEQHCAIVCA